MQRAFEYGNNCLNERFCGEENQVKWVYTVWARQKLSGNDCWLEYAAGVEDKITKILMEGRWKYILGLRLSLRYRCNLVLRKQGSV